MNIPNFNDTQVVDKDGFLTDAWRQTLSQLFSELQKGLSNEGVTVPQQTADNISIIQGNETIGNLIIDSTNNVAKININGTFKTITTS